MSQVWRRAACYIILSLSFFGCSFSTLCAESDASAKEKLVIHAHETHHGDYFAMGNNVEISGTVVGDVYVLATQVYIDGHVTGDVLVCAANAEISGVIDQNIRLVGGQATISGDIGNNVTVVGGNVYLASSGKIQGNLVCIGGSVEAASQIQGEATIAASYLRVSGQIGQQLSAYVGNLRITSKATIAKDLEYRSSGDADIDPHAVIGGKVVHHLSLVHRLFKEGWLHKLFVGSRVAGILMNFTYSFVIGWILLKLFPRNVDQAMKELSNYPLKALGFGMMLLALLPLASLILLMTILGVPFALTLLTLNVITFYTAKIISILWASQAIFRRFHMQVTKPKALAAGLLVYFLLIPIPYVGLLLVLMALLFGLGAGALSGLRRRRAV